VKYSGYAEKYAINDQENEDNSLEQRGEHIMKHQQQRRQKSCFLLVSLLILLVMIGCGSPGVFEEASRPTPSPQPTPIPAATPMPEVTPGPTAMPSPTLIPTSVPTSPPIGSCTPDPGGQPVSSVEVAWGNRNQPRLALTFDAGGSVEPVPRILSILAKYHLHVTFFVTGNWAQQNPDLVRQIWNVGHEIGNHTMTHPNLTQLPDTQVCTEMKQAESVISKITGHTTHPYFRPPSGARDNRVRQLVATLGYRTIYWAIDTIDWDPNTTSQMIIDRVMNNLSNGAIVLMHAGSASEADTLDTLIPMIQQRGYQIVSVTEVLK
jgi:peptidoglycan/xylan/chitin deacetylase (PgdA/CDA1 family)